MCIIYNLPIKILFVGGFKVMFVFGVMIEISIEIGYVAAKYALKDIFGRRDVVESFRFHPTLFVLFLKQIEFYYKF